ncbi:MAG: methyltransferase domain-containing protein [Gammaproteobacteria bacterium]|nr:methyltransferase domain-containing protein [Gammaproteobacteria bacterium]
MSEKTDVNPYQPENVAVFEALYGKHLISLGGTAAIENMVADMSLQHIKALDIGFGIGGVAYYLAVTYQMAISGVEIYPWMVQYAKEHAPADVAQQLHFAIYEENGAIPFARDTFDLAYSKGVLNHVHDKLPLFKNIHACLKEQGVFVIADWIYPTKPPHHTGPLVCETETSYRAALTDAGFSKITFRNDCAAFMIYVRDFLKNLKTRRVVLTSLVGEEMYAAFQQEHEQLLRQLQQEEKIAVRITAKR